MKGLKKIQKNNKALISLLVIIVILGLLVFFARNDSGKGFVEMTIPHQKTTVFVGESRKLRTRADNQQVVLKLEPGEHRILLGSDGFFPYLKNVSVAEGETTTLQPFMYAQSGTINQSDDAEIAITLQNNIVPTLTRPALSDSGNSALWIENNTVLLKWIGDDPNRPDYICVGTECGSGTFVYGSSEDTIVDAEFFPGRDDLVLLQMNQMIHVVEVDRTGNQNIQPVYEGASFVFTARDSVLYILDRTSNTVFERNL